MGVKIPKKKNGLENVFLNIKGTKKKKKRKRMQVCAKVRPDERERMRECTRCVRREKKREREYRLVGDTRNLDEEKAVKEEARENRREVLRAIIYGELIPAEGNEKRRGTPEFQFLDEVEVKSKRSFYARGKLKGE